MSSEMSRIDFIQHLTGAHDKHPSLARAEKFKRTERSGSSRSKSQTRHKEDEKTQDVARPRIPTVVQFSNNGSNLHRRRISGSNHKKLPPQIHPGSRSLPGSKNTSPASSGDDTSPASKIPVRKQGSFTPTLTRKSIQNDEQGSEIRELTRLQKIVAGIALANTDIVLQNLVPREISEPDMITILGNCGITHNFTLLKLIYDQVSNSYKGIHFYTASIALANFLQKGASNVLDSAFKGLTPEEASMMLIAVLKTRSKSQIEKFVERANAGSMEARPLIETGFKNAMDEAIQSEYALGLSILLAKCDYPTLFIDLQLPKSRHPEIVQLLATYASQEACLAALKTAENDPKLVAAIQIGMRDNPKIGNQQPDNELSQIEEVSEIRPASAAPTEVSHAPSAPTDASPPVGSAFSPRQDKKVSLPEE